MSCGVFYESVQLPSRWRLPGLIITAVLGWSSLFKGLALAPKPSPKSEAAADYFDHSVRRRRKAQIHIYRGNLELANDQQIVDLIDISELAISHNPLTQRLTHVSFLSVSTFC
jgi:hypothetical protein